MSHTVHTRALQRAIEILGGVEKLQSHLAVPLEQLLAWMDGREELPPNVFLQLADLLFTEDLARLRGSVAMEDQPLEFSAGPLPARCLNCQGTQFRPVKPGVPLDQWSELVCVSCGSVVRQADLLTRLGTDAVAQARAPASAPEQPGSATQPEVKDEPPADEPGTNQAKTRR